MTIAFFVLLWLFINLMILFIMQFVEEKYSPLELFVEIIAIIISPILWISFWTVVNRIRKARRKRSVENDNSDDDCWSILACLLRL